MRKPFVHFSAAVLTLGLLASPSFADHDKDRDDHHRSEHHDQDRDEHRDHRDWDHDRDHRDHDRDRDDHREHFRHANGHPAGWEHGKKKGWGDCDVPPGQAKKHGCGDRDRDDRDRDDHDRDEHRDRRTTTPAKVPVLKPRTEVHRSNTSVVPVLKPHTQVHRTSTKTVPVLQPHPKSGAKAEVQ